MQHKCQPDYVSKDMGTLGNTWVQRSTMDPQVNDSIDCQNVFAHYENTPIQIYWNFHLQTQKISRQKSDIFLTCLLKT